MKSPHPVSAPAAARPAGFDRVAWCYDWLAALVFGPALRRAQRAALAGLPPGAPHVLVLGGGTGWVLTEIWRLRPRAIVLYLDASAAMLARARRRPAGQAAQVEFRQGTQADLRPGETFDALITFFVLDCIAPAELPAALRRLRAAQRLAAPWLLADFRPPRRWWQRLLLRAMYWFFQFSVGLRVAHLVDLEAALTRLGLRATGQRRHFGGAVGSWIFTETPGNAEK